jgi:hypothetical protein
MKNRTKLLSGGFLAGVAFLALGSWLFAEHSHLRSNASNAQAKAPAASKAEAPAAPVFANPAPPVIPVAPRRQPGLSRISGWQHQIDSALQSPANESQTALTLVGLFPRLPSEGQIEAARHIANLLADSDYNNVKPILLNPGTEKEALNVLYADLLNRPDPTKLRALLDLAQIQNHPLSGQSRSTLTILLGEDHGTDWVKWNSTIAEYVANQAGQ